MYYEFYIDQFVAEQFLMGYLMLSLCIRLQRKEVSWKRIVKGSIGNAALAAVFVLAGIPQGAIAGMLFAGMTVFVGESVRQFVQDILLLLFVTVCFAGTLELLLEMISLPVGAGCIVAAILVKKGWQMFAVTKRMDGRLLTVRLYRKERAETLLAIWDTGNQLTEPLTGRPVSIVEAAAAKRLLGEDWERDRGFYLIPYHSLGTEKSWMRGITIDKLEVWADQNPIVVEKPILGLYEGKVSSAGKYQVILHPDHIR